MFLNSNKLNEGFFFQFQGSRRFKFRIYPKPSSGNRGYPAVTPGLPQGYPGVPTIPLRFIDKRTQAKALLGALDSTSAQLWLNPGFGIRFGIFSSKNHFHLVRDWAASNSAKILTFPDLRKKCSRNASIFCFKNMTDSVFWRQMQNVIQYCTGNGVHVGKVTTVPFLVIFTKH